MILSFGSFQLDTELFELLKDGEPISVEPMVFDLLKYLAENPGKVIAHDELLSSVWKGRIVSETTVATCIKNARKALGDSGSEQKYIKTVRGRGFRFSPPHLAPEKPAVVSAVSFENFANDSVTEPVITGPPTIAVLPLYPFGNDPSHVLYGDAIAQEIIVDLSRLHWLRVIARGSSFQYRDPSIDLNAAGIRLGARYFLSGTLEFFADLAVVSVEFVHAPDARILWADRFECQMDDLLQLRQSICSRIVAEIEARVERAEGELAANIETENLDAWSAYHRGLRHMYRFNKEDNELARQMFERAVSLDGQFARAYAGQSFVHFQNAFLNYSHDIQFDTNLTRRAAQKAMELDPHDPFVNLTLGRADWLEQSLDSAGEWLQRSLTISPNYAFAHYNRGLIHALKNDGEQAQESSSKAIGLSPIDPLGYAMRCTLGISHLVRGDFEQAIRWVDQSLREPNAHVHIKLIGAMFHEIAGNKDRSRSIRQEIRDTNSDYNTDDFFRVFPFQNEDTLSLLKHALKTIESGN